VFDKMGGAVILVGFVDRPQIAKDADIGDRCGGRGRPRIVDEPESIVKQVILYSRRDGGGVGFVTVIHMINLLYEYIFVYD